MNLGHGLQQIGDVGPTHDHRLTLTHLISRLRLLPNAFNWEIFEKLIF